MKIGKFIFLQSKEVALGDGSVKQFTLFEHKKIGGIWFYSWGNVGGESGEGQCRFHTHAFNSIAVTLKGSYNQEVIDENGINKHEVSSLFRPRFLPRHYTHRIINAKPDTWTCVIFGRWSKTWYEYFEDTKTWVEYSWGRKVINKFPNKSFTWIRERINKTK